MDPMFFVKGLIVGFAMAVPIGPIGVMGIRKTLTEGHARGLMIGLGAATAESVHGSTAAFGLTFISDVVTGQQFWIPLVGGAALVFLGVRTWSVKREDPINLFNNKGLWGSYVPALLLALTNPVPIVALAVVFAALGLAYVHLFISGCMLVVGVFGGSCLWLLTLGHVATRFRKSLNSGGLKWVNRCDSILILLSGAATFVSMM